MSACNGCKLKWEFTESRKSANQLRRCAIADTLAACARPPAQSHLRLSMVENRSRRAPTPICVQNPRGPKSLGPANCLPRRAIALGHSPTACAGSLKQRRRDRKTHREVMVRSCFAAPETGAKRPCATFAHRLRSPTWSHVCAGPLKLEEFPDFLPPWFELFSFSFL